MGPHRTPTRRSHGSCICERTGGNGCASPARKTGNETSHGDDTALRRTLSRAAKGTIRRLLPIAARKRLAVWVGRQNWIEHRYYWTLEVLRDLADRDPNAFHRFLWSHHLAYAESYDVAQRLAGDALHPTRHVFLTELQETLGQAGIAQNRIDSVLDVGASLGYVLRHMERNVFPNATRFDGVDIDEYAVEQGAAFLARTGSRVRLHTADMSMLDEVVGAQEYDIVLSTGTLIYLKEAESRAVIASMLRRTRRVLALSGLAHPAVDNATLTQSAVRERDGTFIHNLDAMVEAAGGRVIRRRWDGARQLDGNTIYFVFAVPGTFAKTGIA